MAELMMSLRLTPPLPLLFLFMLSGVVVSQPRCDPPKSVSVSISTSGKPVEGSTVTLTCSSDANPPVETYTWYKGGCRMRTGQTYTIDRITSEDSGVYTCNAKNQYGQKCSTVPLNVLYPPKGVTVSISTSGEPVEGSAVTLTCSGDANPPVETYTWYKGGSSVRIGQTYTINRVKSEDSGSYTCTAENEHGRQSYSVSLNVLYPPKRATIYLYISTSGETVEGSTVTLTCSSDANPPVKTYTWFKEKTFKSKGKTYTITNISTEDGGDYICKANNQYGFKYSNKITLNVLYPPKTVSISTSGETVEGSTVTLTCSSNANPPVKTYTWYKEKIYQIKGNIYTITNISTEDGGDYRCKANNQYGFKYSNKMTLNVLYPPKRVSVSICPSGEPVEGSTVTLTCSSDGNPPVETYTWYKGNESSPVGSGQSLSFTLNSSSVGWFYCVAQNKYGSQKAAAVRLGVKGNGGVILYAVLGLLVACLFVTTGVLCMRRKRKDEDDAVSGLPVPLRPPESSYMLLDSRTRSFNDMYHTLATAHLNCPDGRYTALDPQTRSYNDMYHTFAICNSRPPRRPHLQ